MGKAKGRNLEQRAMNHPIKLSQEHLQILITYTQERNEALLLAQTNTYRWKGLMAELSEVYEFPFTSTTRYSVSDEGLTVLPDVGE